MNIQAWAVAHKIPLGVAGAGAVVGFALWRKKTSAASSSAATPLNGSYVADTSGTDDYNALEGQIGSLQNALAGLAAASPTAGLAPAGIAAGGSATQPAGATSVTGAQPAATLPSLPQASIGATAGLSPEQVAGYNAAAQASPVGFAVSYQPTAQSAMFQPAMAPSDTPGSAGQLLYVEPNGTEVQTLDTAANRASIAQSGGHIVGQL